MNSYLINHFSLIQMVGFIGLVLCPAVCAIMAYRISRSYSQQPLMGLDTRSQSEATVAIELSPIDEAAINEAVKNAIF